MAAQAAYEDAKSQWLQAIKEAQRQKDEARSAYDNEKSDGLTNDSFSQWAIMNYPALNFAYRNYQSAEARYMAAFANFDGQGQGEWQHKKQQALAPILAKGGDESQFIIYTGEE
ncbi:hypothetical protein FAVG1_09210 [Fusarium avenaceum]|nr:hypothetical protein FAVG1_09210 [Fusarium avenaceum]